MNKYGFQITHLTLQGTNVPDAVVVFGPGLNVISGPSDTGKTFIGECIDYAFGASKPPGEIPESKGYGSILLGIKALTTDVEYTLRRSLRGGGTTLTAPNQPDRILGEKHQKGNKDTISSFLLSLCGLENRFVRKNDRGETRQVSFRDITQLTVVSEEVIIRKLSPLYSGNPIDKTAEKSVFGLLLTGVDDSSVVALPNKKVVAAESKGKTEILEILITQAKVSLGEIAPGKNQAELSEQLQRHETNIDDSMKLFSTEQQTVSVLEDKRREVWKQYKENQSRIAVLSELKKRFTLLKAQYKSDLRRLESVAEAGTRLGQLDEIRCPVCGAQAEYHTQQNPDHVVSPTAIIEACVAEAERLKLLLFDLDQTIENTNRELTNTTEMAKMNKLDMQATDNQLTTRLKPRLREALIRLQDARNLHSRVRQALELHTRIDVLEKMRDQYANAKKSQPKTDYVSSVDTAETDKLAIKIEEILRAWQFPDLQRVTYNTEDHDILISGRKRADHGKGVRAITHAAFTIGLMYYCIDNHLPHSGVVVIDSPLVVYREPDAGENEFSPGLKDHAYAYLAAQENRGQIIILENEDPPNKLPDSPTVIRFTGASHGRKGFIPLSSKADSPS